ncbi:MAG: hypothetical protein UT11_C0040G0014 [Berkelbacteria bacterium GW2011_GWA2_38_9]|uniref:Uncharacterized protein n=1 Tax=Berkelbacteria bacterium GW2011_GWA2_38_9 TaxID=1618334 RepID=A0A0G0LAU0_9BACT|nr:MAG: hypothetical protein UT11_C0040G0014 [Berkelbacteria bacterium GW2011_GWA2_38_9]
MRKEKIKKINNSAYIDGANFDKALKDKQKAPNRH